MDSTTYYDTWPAAQKALEAAVLLGLKIEFRNVLCPEPPTGCLVRYALTVSSEDPPVDAVLLLTAPSEEDKIRDAMTEATEHPGRIVTR